MKSDKAPLATFTPETLSQALEAPGFERYRAEQVLDWFYSKGAREFREMKNVSAPVIAWLEEHCLMSSSRLAAAHDAGDGSVKLKIALADGETIEAVIIEAAKRVTLCVSSQAGCPLACQFCATGAAGFARNLDALEIVEQALHAASLVGREERISNIVVMGMGEPCLNLDAVLDAVRVFNAPWAFGIGARKITVSTIGYPKCIARLADFPMEVGLAISLHAATDDLRRRLCPHAPASISETVAAAMKYFDKTGREVTFEYVLLAGVNDRPEDVDALAALLSGRQVFVNLIPYNEVEGLPFRRPSPKKLAGFRRSLRAKGLNAEIRESRGGGARAACGQLRLETAKTGRGARA